MIHLNEIQEQEKLIDGGENQNNGCLAVGRRLRIDWEGVWGNFLDCWFSIYLSGLSKCALKVCSLYVKKYIYTKYTQKYLEGSILVPAIYSEMNQK